MRVCFSMAAAMLEAASRLSPASMVSVLISALELKVEVLQLRNILGDKLPQCLLICHPITSWQRQQLTAVPGCLMQEMYLSGLLDEHGQPRPMCMRLQLKPSCTQCPAVASRVHYKLPWPALQQHKLFPHLSVIRLSPCLPWLLQCASLRDCQQMEAQSPGWHIFRRNILPGNTCDRREMTPNDLSIWRASSSMPSAESRRRL